MARPPRHIPRDLSRRRVWVYIAVAAFVLFDIVLIVLAFGATHAGAKADAPRPIPTFTNEPVSNAPAATPAPTAAAPKATAVVAVPPTRILAALDGTTAWRATTGACPAAVASPELTTDSGATWKTTNATGPAKVTALQSIQVSTSRVATMVGFNQADCAPQLVKTYVGGDNYLAYPKDVAGAWYVNPANRAVVHSPKGDFAAPCPTVIAVAPRDPGAAAVLCADQMVYTTIDAAAGWSQPGSVPGAINLTATSAGYIATAAGLPECAGVQMIALSPESMTAKPTGCLLLNVPPANLPGNVAVSEAAGIVWVWASEVLRRSPDEGITWR